MTGVRQACSHYACGDPGNNTGCATKMQRHHVDNVTGFAINEGQGRIGRNFVADLWKLD